MRIGAARRCQFSDVGTDPTLTSARQRLRQSAGTQVPGDKIRGSPAISPCFPKKLLLAPMFLVETGIIRITSDLVFLQDMKDMDVGQIEGMPARWTIPRACGSACSAKGEPSRGTTTVRKMGSPTF